MGSYAFTETSTERDVDTAYRKLVAAAHHEYGHDPYNGTISTTSGYRVVTNHPVSAHEAERLRERRLDVLHKWEACEAVPVGVPAKTAAKTIRFTVPFDGGRPGESLAVTAAMVAAALGVADSRLASFEVLESSATFTTRRRAAGPAEKYWTTSAGGQFATKTEAVAYATRRVEQDALAVAQGPPATRIVPIREVTVYQATVRRPEAAVVRTLKSWKVKVKAHVNASDELEFHHWMFYGWAAS